jgi:hypothetical protein
LKTEDKYLHVSVEFADNTLLYCTELIKTVVNRELWEEEEEQMCQKCEL